MLENRLIIDTRIDNLYFRQTRVSFINDLSVTLKQKKKGNKVRSLRALRPNIPKRFSKYILLLNMHIDQIERHRFFRVSIVFYPKVPKDEILYMFIRYEHV